LNPARYEGGNVLKAGIDMGSVMVKCVIVNGETIIAKSAARNGPMPEIIADTVLQQALKNAEIDFSLIEKIVCTGYGRYIFTKAHATVTEISAAAKASFLLSGKQRCLVIDIGGQDTKIIEVDHNGEVVDFLMNDKCAAGTGRFLEMMAGVLGTDLHGFGTLSLKAERPVTINATCSVFAESEVISLLAHNEKKDNIAAGLLNAIAGRISTMLNHFQSQIPVFFCGGPAEIPGLKQAIEKISGRNIRIFDNPGFVVAYGAALCVFPQIEPI